MVQSTSRSAGGQAGAVRNQFAQQSGLPFLDVLSATEVESTCRAYNHKWRNRIYTPWITLSMFLVADPFLRSLLWRRLGTFPEVPQRLRAAACDERHGQLLRGSPTIAGRSGLGIGASFRPIDS